MLLHQANKTDLKMITFGPLLSALVLYYVTDFIPPLSATRLYSPLLSAINEEFLVMSSEF